ncbi:DUF5701 family protein [Sanguibacter sp. HDW7]|uniref:DUF5701 family protein n=1 Tax=Sanguibacter sp. HDW7 TaxID=2714931 RepID=UPI001409385E|nr:DUF5701 family protein [Sanguibacter sp. HDW7]QIK83681.1 hypothetical protein G7063_08625 [Sanguibacter sp. HDW7]
MHQSALPSLTAQAERLVDLSLVADADSLRARAAQLELTAPAGSLLVLHERVLPASALAPRLHLPAPGRAGVAGETREGFVVVDMTDVDEFSPTAQAELPDADVYAVLAPERGDEMRNWSPEEALPALVAASRTPLTLVEGIHWALQAPGVVEANACFMTIGSRKIKPNGTPDARTPALWISSGTGRDGRERKGAPKVGWCWWGNRHTWLGFASSAGRAGA